MVKNAAAQHAIEYMREWDIARARKGEAGIRPSIFCVEQHIESLECSLEQATDGLTSALENNRRLAEKLAAAEEVIETAREWRAAALAADKRATEAEIKMKSLQADIAMLKRQRDGAGKRAIEAENELRLTQQELEYAKRRAQENENARTTVAAIALALDEHNATES